MAGIGIIVNRNAARVRSFRGRIGEKLGFILGDPASLRETFEVSEIEDVARLFLDREIDILGIGGGDGSNQRVLSTFTRIYGDHPLPRVLLLRGGTHTGGFAYADVEALARDARGPDAHGYRAEFLGLVQLAGSLNGS